MKMLIGRCVLGLALVLVTCGLAVAQDLPMAPVHGAGQGITGAFEGWFPNQDGSFTLLMGYFNRNQEEALDIPIGPNNDIEPGGPDQGQPTHFLSAGRQWGIFSIKVPKDFGDKKLTWSITANGKTSVVPLSLSPLWRLEPFVDATNNTPPYLGFSNEGPFVNGPIGQSESLTAKVGAPLTLTIWVADDAKDPLLRQPGGKEQPVVTGHWIVFRGPAAVKFDPVGPTVEKTQLVSPPPGTPFNGKATTTAIFPEPGDYILNYQAEDQTGGGPAGRQCCWSNVKIKVSVTK